MTKRPVSDREVGDRPAQNLQESRESYDRIVDEYRQAPEGREDAPALKSVDFTKSYIEGRLRIFVRYEALSARSGKSKSFIAVWGNDRETSHEGPGISASSIHNRKLVDHQRTGAGDQDVMLVSDVELVDAVKFTSVMLEWSDIVENKTRLSP